MVEQAIRKHYPAALASLVRRVQSLDLAEDCLQEACSRALDDWSRQGLPDEPGAWLVRVGHRLAIDHFRKQHRWDKLAPYIAHEMETAEQNSAHHLEQCAQEQVFAEDALLRLIFTCCHPALAFENQVAMALKHLMGLNLQEIARAFLQNPRAIEQRLTRAKRKISTANIPYHIPRAADLPERIDAVLTVLYLIFNEGYCSSDTDHPIRLDLCDQAIHLTRSIHRLAPEHAETQGLLALMLGHRARHYARLSPLGEWVPMEHQDRTLWDQQLIQLADHYLTQALQLGRAGPYQLQAAIVALHNQASTFETTDWKQILLLYNLLQDIQPSPVVRLNRVVALWYATGDATQAQAALTKLREDQPRLTQYLGYHITQAHLLEALNRAEEAQTAYKNALELSANSAERKVLIKKINRFSSQSH